MKIKSIIILSLLFIYSCSSESDSEKYNADFEKYKQHVITLSSDECEGRAPGTPGGVKTKNYIASRPLKSGLLIRDEFPKISIRDSLISLKKNKV